MNITPEQLEAIKSAIATFNSPHESSEAETALGHKMALATLSIEFPTITEAYCKDYACEPRKLDMVAELKKI